MSMTTRRGFATVEYALTLPLIILSFLGLMEVGRAWFDYGLVTQAVHEGARLAAVLPDLKADDPIVIARMQDVLHRGGIDPTFSPGKPNQNVNFAVGFVSPLQPGRLVRVSARVNFPTAIAQLLPENWRNAVPLRAEMITRYH